MASLLGLFVVMIALAAIPSTSVALVVTRSATRGFLSGAAAAAGIVIGDLIFLGLAIWGMTALAGSMGALFAIVKFVAGLYLILLGVRLLLPGLQHVVALEASAASTATSFLGGLVITLGDVKAIFFYASLLPVFVDLGSLNAVDILWIAGITVVAVGGVKLVYAALALKIMAKMRQRRVARGGEVIAGSALAGAGVYMIVKT